MVGVKVRYEDNNRILTGARQGMLSGIRRWLAAAMARDLRAFIIPGPEIGRAYGLDLEAAGLQKVSSPRHASVLVIIGDIPPALRDAATVIYAQMMRPRALLVLGTKEVYPLPTADIAVGLSQQEVVEGVRQLRTLFSQTAFHSDISDYDAPALQIRIEYVCPMHPEVVQDKPGSCPKCGMNLMPREIQANSAISHTNQAALEVKEKTQAETVHEHHHVSHDGAVEYTCPMHPEVLQSEPGSCPECGMNLEIKKNQAKTEHEHHYISHDAAVEYTCPMHPEVLQNEPGSCPKCGMNLEVKEAQAEMEHEHHHMSHDAAVEYTCPMHPEVLQSEPGSCPKCGMNLEVKEAQAEMEHEHHHMSHDAAVEYTCPMHPEVVQSEPGSCPKCGMFLESRDKSETQNHDYTSMNHTSADHNVMDHGGMDHDEMGFMSMIDVTKDLPRSNDGLQMEWISAPFGPFFPGLPGGLLLTLSLDGDTVASSEAQSLFDNIDLLENSPVDTISFVDRIAGLDPTAPISYRLLACQALEKAAGIDVPIDVIHARIGGLERERIASHLNWLVLFAEQIGFDWLMQQAALLQLKIQQADIKQIILIRLDIIAMIKRLNYTPLLKSRTVGIGRLMPDAILFGPVARACGINEDARATDTHFTALGFTAASREQGDVFARLQVRLEEMLHSFALIKAAGDVAALPVQMSIGDNSGKGEVVVETPRGKAYLKLTLEQGRVIAAQLRTPSKHHLALIETLTEQQALTDALVAVGSLDLSAWEM